MVLCPSSGMNLSYAHAVNVMKTEAPGDALILSERPAFEDAFNPDYDRIESDPQLKEKFATVFNRKRYYVDGTTTIDFVKVRDEVFAKCKGYPRAPASLGDIPQLFTNTDTMMESEYGRG